MKKMINNIQLEIVQGDIAWQPDMTAIVTAANAELRIGGGVAEAIHIAAGPELKEECGSLAPIQPGEATIYRRLQTTEQICYTLPGARIWREYSFV